MNRETRTNRFAPRYKKTGVSGMAILLSAVLFLTLCSMLFGSSFSDAHGNRLKESVDCKYYKSILIKKGDTLLSIAKKYRTEQYDSTQEYVDELKRINALKSDFIQEDQYLLISYDQPN